MKKIVRRIAVVIGAAALSVGLVGTAVPAQAASQNSLSQNSLMKDTSWPF